MVIGKKVQQTINNQNKNSKEWKTTLNGQRTKMNETRKKKEYKRISKKKKHETCSSNLQINIHYEKPYPLESHCLIIKAPKQLIYNYTTIKAWKWMQLINKMSHQKIKKLYYSCNLVWNGTPIHYNVHIIHKDIINHVWFFDKLHFICVWQLHYNYYKCRTQATTMLWLMYNYRHIWSCHVYIFPPSIRYYTYN